MAIATNNSSLEQYFAFLKGIGLILCTMALIGSARPSLFQPAAPDESRLVERRLRALWFALQQYYVDYGAYPAYAGADAGPPHALISPVSYLAAVEKDPYSSGASALAERLDPSGRGPVRQVSLALIALFGLRSLAIVRGRRRWRIEMSRGGAELWAGGAVALAWCAAILLLSPAALRMTVLIALAAGAFGLFGLKRLTQGALLLIGLAATAAVFALLTERVALWRIALIAAALAAARTALFYWTLHVRRAQGALGRYRLALPGAGFLLPLGLYLTLACSIGLLALIRAQLTEEEHIARLAGGGEPFAFASTPEFFVVSSNGPDYARNWREEVLFRLLGEEGLDAAEQYLRYCSYDPTNGLRSGGDMLKFGLTPKVE